MLLSLAACSESEDPKTNNEGNAACAAGEFDSTFAAIQKVVFEGRGCTANVCHGSAMEGGLDLRAGAAYDQLIEAKSQGSELPRVQPGQPSESYLYAKLQAATEPGSVTIAGAPMPSGMPALSAEHLEAIRRWIGEGAPETGSVLDPVTGSSESVAALLDSCLPPATPTAIKPLEPPGSGEGVQFAMPAFPLKASSETEVCFAQYYDFSSVVPAEFQDPARGVFFVNGKRTRQDPQSHHLALAHSKLGAEFVNHPSFGEWRCRGGDRDGQACDALSATACGAGICATDPKPSLACIGYGPPEAQVNVAVGNIGGAQTAQQYIRPIEGVYEEIPTKGIVFWNSHAFNLTTHETTVHAWLNLAYTSDLRFKITQGLVSALDQVVGQAPFTKKNYCGKWVAPQGSTLYWLTTHTHKRGSNFTVTDPAGKQIYRSNVYSDPVTLFLERPMTFDVADPGPRTMTYCADFNNGVKEDGSPDLELATRASRMPNGATCQPVACTAGKIGAPCAGAADNAACDSSPGTGDGLCDACAITAGVTTENEMFFFLPGYSGGS